MNQKLRDWLLACPSLSYVSTLVIDAHALGLIDLPTAIIPAIADFVRLNANGTPGDYGDPYHFNRARLGAICRHRPRICLLSPVALLYGTISVGAAVSQSQRSAVIHLTSPIPQTLLCAAVGRRLSEVVDAPLLKRSSYVITAATGDWRGCSIEFDVPIIPSAWLHAFHAGHGGLDPNTASSD